MRTSYHPEDVTLLLKDITGLVTPLPAAEREKYIQSGTHYCEMLPLEYTPAPAYLEAYEQALITQADAVAAAVRRTADLLYAIHHENLVLVSLARAGIPIGILLRWQLQRKYRINVPHYAISIIRGRGIDHNAMRYLLSRYAPEQLRFVDGWTGKGAIYRELQKELAAYPGVSPDLAVLSDPANLTPLCGTHMDLLIPSSCLNCTVSGLISRTFLRKDIIGQNDFHGAAYYGQLAAEDRSYPFLHAIAARLSTAPDLPEMELTGTGLAETEQIVSHFGISDINFVKPGIGEATRVLLRRVPWKLLVREGETPNGTLKHLFQLAQEKNVPIETYPLKHYRACGIIKRLADT